MSIELPKVLVQELIKRGLDESFIVDVLSKELKLDLNDVSKAHEELALRMYNEGIENLNKGDVIQASEKLYKAVEETIKALAIRRGLPEATEALERGRWSVVLLDSAAQKLGDIVFRAWDAAYFLHVNGFHEVRIGIDAVKSRVPVIKAALDLVTS